MAGRQVATGLMAVALVWMVVGVGVMRLEIGKWVNDLGAILKVIIIFSLGVGGIVLAVKHGAANTINASSFLPSFGVAKKFLPVIVFLMLGFELISSMAGEVKEPEKRIPRAILTSGAVIAFLYMFATIGILLALSVTKLTSSKGWSRPSRSSSAARVSARSSSTRSGSPPSTPSSRT